jgi:phage terminase small subunit
LGFGEHREGKEERDGFEFNQARQPCGAPRGTYALGVDRMKRVKAGTSKAAAAARKVAFAHAYIANDGNGLQAAITAGYSPNGAGVTASRMLKDLKVQALIADATANAAKISGLTVERTLREVSRLAYSDPRKFYRKDGQLIPIHELDDDTAACIASIEVDEIGSGDKVIGHTKKIKHWDKNAALEKAMKYHGLYEEDNRQKPPPVVIMENPREVARRMAFILAHGAVEEQTPSLPPPPRRKILTGG